MSRGQSQLLTPGTRIKFIVFFGALSLSSVLFKSTLNNAKCKGIGFTDSDLNCRGWIKGARCLCVCNHVGELSKLRTRKKVLDIDQWFPTVKRSLFIGLK